MSATRTMLIGSLVWALVFILAAYALRGRAVGTWIQGVLFAGWTGWFYYRTAKIQRASCRAYSALTSNF